MSVYQHWQLAPGTGEAPAVLTLAVADHAANALHVGVLDELEEILARLETDVCAGLVIRNASGRPFSVGADVREFTQLADAEAAQNMLRRGQQLFARLARLPYPTVAVIGGHCLGGGFELALACDYRVADDADDVRIGLPEVKLGIHPGYGGAVRLVRLIGDVPALQLMLAGRTVGGRAAKRLGLVDAAVPTRGLDGAACALLKARPAVHRPKVYQRVPHIAWLRNAVAWGLVRLLRRRVNAEHYPAPFALLRLWQQMDRDLDAALVQEATSVTQLFATPTAQNLVRLFLQRNALRQVEAVAPVAHVHVIGSGAMGGDIAAWCAAQGLRVTVQDLDAERLAPLFARAEKIFTRAGAQARGARDRLIADPEGLGVGAADVIIEAVVEDCAVKQALFKDIEPRLKADALLATNTSSLSLADVSAAMANPARLIGLHFFNPVARMPLVEVIHDTQTTPEQLAAARAFVRRINKVPLAVRSVPGFLVNRVLLTYLMEAVRMHEEGIDVGAIDQAARAYGMPMGPLELADMVGLDICQAAGATLAAAHGLELPRTLAEKIDAGHLGRKSGQGFYRWHKGQAKRRRPRRKAPADVIVRLEASLAAAAVHCWHERLVDDAAQLDAGIVLGCGFAPHRGGPLNVVRGIGGEQMRSRLAALAERYGERFEPGPGWTAPELQPGELP